MSLKKYALRDGLLFLYEKQEKRQLMQEKKIINTRGKASLRWKKKEID